MATDKFKELTHFVIHECRDRPESLGAIRLNKTLWYADVLAYQTLGTTITNGTYIKRDRGPVPANILRTLEELKNENKISIEEPSTPYAPRKYFSLVPPEGNLLTDEEKMLTRDVLSAVCSFNANGISKTSHDIIWESAQDGEEIPFEATLAAFAGEITASVRSWASSVARGTFIQSYPN